MRQMVVRVGDEEAKLRLDRATPFLQMINDDIAQHWDKWVEAADAKDCINGQKLSVALAFATNLLGLSAHALIHNGYSVSKADFAKMAGDIYDLHVEAVELKKRSAN